MRYQIVLIFRVDGKRIERVVKDGIRRYNGAVAEHDIAIASAKDNAWKHNPDGRVIIGPGHDPNEVGIVSMLPDGTEHEVIVALREVGRENPDLTPLLFASLVALGVTPSL